MLDVINNVTLDVMDILLGWLLRFPAGVALAAVALGTSAILTFVRPFTTNQDLLKRCKQDKKRLGTLIREAKRRNDKEALTRYRASMAAIAAKTMKAEGKPLLVAILPIAALAIWCFARLGYVPPEPGEPVAVHAYFPASAIGEVTHMAPLKGVVAQNGWAQHITEDPKKDPDGKVNGVASWTLHAERSDDAYVLKIRSAGKTVEKELLVDGRRYSPVIESYGGGPAEVVQIDLESYRPFGFVPGIPTIHWGRSSEFPWFRVYTRESDPWFFAPWLLGYLLIAIPFVFLLRRLCHIH